MPPTRCAKNGYETIMITAILRRFSTDYDTSDRLYFERSRLKMFLPSASTKLRRSARRLIVQFGGQTPLNLSLPLKGPASM